MGNHLACCRQRWSQLDDTDSESFTEESHQSEFCFRNSAIVMDDDQRNHTELWKLSGVSPVRSQCQLAQYSNDAICNFTQHISEREPDDVEFDPSLNASRPSLFILDATNNMRGACRRSSVMFSHIEGIDGRPLRNNSQSDAEAPRRWSSCSTVYIGAGCMVAPHQESTLWSVAIAIELLIRGSRNRSLCLSLSSGSFHKNVDHLNSSPVANQIYHDVYRIFDERSFPLGRCSDTKRDHTSPTTDLGLLQCPDAAAVHQFLCGLFSISLLGPQCAIVALILLERLMNAAEVGILTWSWRRQLLACLLVASKVLDDQAVWNTDYCQILKDLSVKDLNALERHTLSLLQFNIDIPLSVYARYYFDLLTVGEARGMANHHWERRRLTPSVAKLLRILPPGNNTTSTCETSELNTRLLFDLPRGVIRPNTHFVVGDLSVDFKSAKTKRAQVTRPTVFSNSEEYSSANSPCVYHKHHSVSTGPATLVPSNATEKTDFTCNFQTYSPDSTKSGTDEGPLILDEETEFVNTLTLSSPPCSLKRPLKPTMSSGKSQSPRFPYFHAMSNRSVHFVPPPSDTLSRNDRAPFSPTHRPPYYPCNPITRLGSTNAPGVMRSILGGDVAYSLLCDGGMF